MIRRAHRCMLGWACLSFNLLLVGCGVDQEYSNQPIVKVPPVEQVRSWLADVAASGGLDSGIESMKEEIVPTLDIPNRDQFAQEMNRLSTMRNPRQISAKAKEMLKLLPPEEEKGHRDDGR